MYIYHEFVSLLTISVFFVLLLVFVEGNKIEESSSNHRCNKVKRTEKIAQMYESGPCVQAYKARCGWFSLDLCTFYKKEICDKNSNRTQYYYSTVSVCCDDYIEAPNGTCISVKSADPIWVLDKENKTEIYTNVLLCINDAQKGQQIVHSNEEESVLSKGAIAGAGCAVVFLIIVIAFTVIGIRKRRLRRPKKKPELDNEGETMLTSST
ncbi:Hypothetical predicted protein [Mytilus galloprovincialis]|uniref:Uncharacterized protein n=1 Tax=Mytilus galloprovincialis TaxID=29158 RepID=A0A8B6BVY1_MYTGA|nr:Hypothetical predicted protein [Mytilus galloprovincialis]